MPDRDRRIQAEQLRTSLLNFQEPVDRRQRRTVIEQRHIIQLDHTTLRMRVMNLLDDDPARLGHPVELFQFQRTSFLTGFPHSREDRPLHRFTGMGAVVVAEFGSDPVV